MVGRPAIEELKSICFKCKNAMIVDAEQVQRMMAPSPLGGTPMVQEAHMMFFQAFCCARGMKQSMNPECTVYKCTDFVEIEKPLEFREPKEVAERQEPSRLLV